MQTAGKHTPHRKHFRIGQGRWVTEHVTELRRTGFLGLSGPYQKVTRQKSVWKSDVDLWGEVFNFLESIAPNNLIAINEYRDADNGAINVVIWYWEVRP